MLFIFGIHVCVFSVHIYLYTAHIHTIISIYYTIHTIMYILIYYYIALYYVIIGIKGALTAYSLNKAHTKAIRAAQTEKGQNSEGKDDKASDSKTAEHSKKEGEKEEDEDVIDPSHMTEAERIRLSKLMGDMSIHMFNVMWSASELDIRNTLTHVCTKVTHDHSVDEGIRTLRLKGLLILGEVFLECGGSTTAGLDDIIQRMTTQGGGKPGADGKTGVDGKMDKESSGRPVSSTEEEQARPSSSRK